MGWHRRSVRAGAAALLLAGAVAFSGCSVLPGGYACPAIGYLDTFTVRLSGPGAATALVELCDGTMCTASTPTPAPAPSLVGVTPGASASPMPPGSAPGPVQVRRSGQEWTFTGAFPSRFEVRAVSPAGTVLAHEEVSPVWRRIGGSAECGGPHAASLSLTVPAG